MAATRTITVLASALCLFSLLGSTYGSDCFFVEGRVYCDTCRTQFVTRVSEYMPGARVKLECRNREGGDLTYSLEGVTDESGMYSLPVDGDHSADICEVILVKSSKPGCEEIGNGPFLRNSARISLTSDNGMATPIREANPLGFLAKLPYSVCADVLRELGITPQGLID
ncbi:hypothetical protein MLD38_010720 [Melastoma candidum]|uniref:Uncharacterized protein n=1 Tax=Melastoma candidum TaxID=119954 RepID=A0ACB9R4W2_9MYRT|nr:hypothetical protein MLD38_010720 [Melastoma candidum]